MRSDRVVAGNSAGIEVIARIRPTKSQARHLYRVDYEKGELEFRVPRDLAAGYVNNQRELYNFTFNGMLDEKSTQEQVFDVVARKMVDNVIQGFNSTVFAYGQTGSGKTFTITGGAERYEDRGLIPRTLQALFQDVTQKSSRNVPFLGFRRPFYPAQYDDELIYRLCIRYAMD